MLTEADPMALSAGKSSFRPGTRRVDMQTFMPKFKHQPKLPTKMVNVNLTLGRMFSPGLQWLREMVGPNIHGRCL